MFVFSCCKPTILPDRRKEVSLPPTDGSSSSPALDAEMMRSKSDSRILQRTAAPSGNDRRGSTGSSARSLFEASAYRVASHSSSTSGLPDIEHGGIPEKFLELYVAAFRDSNVRWASESEIADMFAPNAKLISQDKQTTAGKANVLRRLDQGVEMLVKMAGKDAAVPEWEIKGPTLTDALAHQYKCTVKRGMMKISFSIEFLIVGGKIAQLRNTRL